MYISPQPTSGEAKLFSVSTDTWIEAWRIGRTKGGIKGIHLGWRAVKSIVQLGKTPRFEADLQQLQIIEANLRVPSPNLSAFIIKLTMPIPIEVAVPEGSPVTALAPGEIKQISA